MLFLSIIKDKKAAGFFEKLFPFFKEDISRGAGKKGIWIHAVSLGEQMAASEFILKLLEEAKTPVYVSATTKTGFNYAKKFCENYEGRVNAIYFPYDFYFSVKKAISIINPSLFICIETEIWPNLFNMLNKEEAKITIINARVSEKSFSNYKAFLFFFRYVFSSINLVLCISSSYCEKFLALGFNSENLHATGNMKFDSSLPFDRQEPGKISGLWNILSSGFKVITAGSTHEGEEKIILDIFLSLTPDFKNIALFLAPRHPERFNYVWGLINELPLKPGGGKIKCLRLSEIYEAGNKAEFFFKGEEKVIILVDIMGELGQIYNLCDVAFVGGSMIDAGGHNLLEPLFFGKPVVFGPYVENFTEIAEEIEKTGAGRKASTAFELQEAIRSYLSNEENSSTAKKGGMELIEKNKGVSMKNLIFLRNFLKP